MERQRSRIASLVADERQAEAAEQPASSSVRDQPLGKTGSSSPRGATPKRRRRGWLVRRMLVLADLLGLAAAFACAELLFGPSGRDGVDAIAPVTETLLFLATLPGWVVMAKLYGLYDRDESRTDHSTTDDLFGVFHLVTVGAWLFFAGSWLIHVSQPGLPKLFTFWALAITFVTTGRAGARFVCRRSPSYIQNTVIVGVDEVGRLIARKFSRHPEYGVRLIGFVDPDVGFTPGESVEPSVLGGLNDLADIVGAFDVERAVIAFSGASHDTTIQMIRSLNDLGVQADIVPPLFEVISPGSEMHAVEGLPLIAVPALRLPPSSRFLKRALDIAGSLIGLVGLAPLSALIALLIKLDSHGPVFFRQVRMGSDDRTFRIFKFRTMVADADARKRELEHLNRHALLGCDARMFKIAGDPRVTRVGGFLRRYSLDELPQLLNVLKGDMSLVGPRPLILDEHLHVADWAQKRLQLKPGMTGLWQVLGRSDIPFDEMVKIDYLYVTTWSLAGDVEILCRTVPIVFKPAAG